jgi:cation diffusion facilitator family transporter
MHTDSIAAWEHDHIFGQDQVRSGEKRTLIVVVITAGMMIAEILVGIAFGSMALLADGIHMGSHMVGLLIALIAYIYARKHAGHDSFSFGTGKVNSLAGYTSAILLAVFALFMGYESVLRLFHPVTIAFDVSIAVAVIGLVVNGASMFILGEEGHTHDHGRGHEHHEHDHDAQEHHEHDHDAQEQHEHDHDAQEHHEHDHDAQEQHEHDHGAQEHHEHDHGGEHKPHGTGADHNLRSAYMHVFADALTSVFAIAALLAAKYFGWIWADPMMGIVGAILVARWSLGLVGSASQVLLDRQIPTKARNRITDIIESYKDTRVCDFHVWCIGPGIFSANMSLVTSQPEAPDNYKRLIPPDTGVVHATIEVHQCPGPD